MSDGGPAFPFEHGHSPGAVNVRECGMSLRAYFAARAMQGLIARIKDSDYWMPECQKIARDAVEYADALILALGIEPH